MVTNTARYMMIVITKQSVEVEGFINRGWNKFFKIKWLQYSKPRARPHRAQSGEQMTIQIKTETKELMLCLIVQLMNVRWTKKLMILKPIQALRKKGRAAGEKRSFSSTWAAFRKQRQRRLYNQSAVQDGAIIGTSGAKNTCLFLETAYLGICPLYVCTLESASVGADPLVSWCTRSRSKSPCLCIGRSLSN